MLHPGTGDWSHRRVEVGRRQKRAFGQQITQPAGDDTGARSHLQHVRGSKRGHAPRYVGCIINKDHRAQAPVVFLRNVANEACRVAAHETLPS
jgi:hypothetical protein